MIQTSGSRSRSTILRANRRCTSSTAQGLCPTNWRSAWTSAAPLRAANGPIDLRSPIEQQPVHVNARPLAPLAASHGLQKGFQELLQTTIQGFQSRWRHARYSSRRRKEFQELLNLVLLEA